MIDTLLLDFYGTIARYGDDIREGEELTWRQIFDRLRRSRPSLRFADFLGEWKSQYERRLEPDEITEGSVFLTKIALTCRRCGVEPEPRMLDEMGTACLETWHRHIHLPPQTSGVLGRLSRRFRLGLVSNFDHPAHLKDLLSRHRLTAYFEVVVISGDVGVNKPDRRIFELALEGMGGTASCAAYVGDSIRDDVGGARAAGCLPILIDPSDRHPDFEGLRVRSLLEILALDLDGWRAAAAPGA